MIDVRRLDHMPPERRHSDGGAGDGRGQDNPKRSPSAPCRRRDRTFKPSTSRKACTGDGQTCSHPFSSSGLSQAKILPADASGRGAGGHDRRLHLNRDSRRTHSTDTLVQGGDPCLSESDPKVDSRDQTDKRSRRFTHATSSGSQGFYPVRCAPGSAPDRAPTF